MKTEPSELLRRSLLAALKAHGLTVSGWCKLADIREGTLRNFLKGRSETLTVNSLASLAKAIKEPVSTLLGETPSSTYDFVSIDREVVDEWQCSYRLEENKKFSLHLPDDLRFLGLVHYGAVIRDRSADALFPPGSIVTYVRYEDAQIDPKDGDIILFEMHKDMDYSDIISSSGKYHQSIRRIIESNGELWIISSATDPILYPPIRLPERIKFDHDEEFPYQTPPSFFSDGIYCTIVGLINASYRREGAADRFQRQSHNDAIED